MRNDIFISELCRNICCLCRQWQFSQEQAAELLGINLDAIAMIEEGCLPPELTCDALARFCCCCGVGLKELFLPVDYPEA